MVGEKNRELNPMETSIRTEDKVERVLEQALPRLPCILEFVGIIISLVPDRADEEEIEEEEEESIEKSEKKKDKKKRENKANNLPAKTM